MAETCYPYHGVWLNSMHAHEKGYYNVVYGANLEVRFILGSMALGNK